MCAKQEDLGLAPSPLPITHYPFPLPFLSPSPSLSLPLPFCALLGTAKQLFYRCDAGELGLKIYQFIPSVHLYIVYIFIYTAFHIRQFHVIMGLCLLAGRVYLLFNKRSIGIAAFPGCLLGTFFDI